VKRAAIACAALALSWPVAAAAQPPPAPSHDDFGRRARTDAGVVERDVVDVAPQEGVAIEGVQIDNRLGNVRVEGHDGDGITVLAVKRAPSDDVLERLKVSLVPDPNGPVRIRTLLAAGPEARPIAAGTIAIDLVLRVPRNARAQVVVWRGNIIVKNIDRGGELTVNAGDIEVEHVSGAVSTRGMRGDQRFVEVIGDVEAEGVTGSLTMDVIRGRLAARVHDGRIIARRVDSGDVALRTTTGDIDFSGTLRAGGTYRIASLRGNVSVEIARDAAVRIDARASGALIVPAAFRARRRGKRLVGLYGGGQRPAGITLVSRLGDVRVGFVETLETRTP